VRRKAWGRIHGPVARSKVTMKEAATREQRFKWIGRGRYCRAEKCGRSGILRSGRRSLTGGYERNVGESRKEWQLVAEAQQKENNEGRTG
jgi:hypothetical protein